ncbi:MAG: OmpA family protein [Myxococcota bacterium]
MERVRSLKGQLDTAWSENERLNARVDEIEDQNNQLTARLSALGQNVEELETTRASLESDLERTQRALRELQSRERQAQGRLETFRNLIDRFQAMIESGRLRVRIARNQMVVELPQGILFDAGRIELKPQGEETLREVANVLATIADRSFQIAGHTDDRPIRTQRFPSNWELSAGRGVTVTRFLVENGVPANRLSAAGYADTQPVASNDADEGRAQNRRIEIVLVPNLDELPDLSSLQSSN